MLRKKENKKINKVLVILGSLLFLSGLSLISYKLYDDYRNYKNEENALNNFYIEEEQIVIDDGETEEVEQTEIKETTISYVAALRIPKINLTRGLVAKNSKYNNISYNIMIHSESDTPDTENGNVILIAHSGNSSVSYFKNLDKLDINDIIYLDYNNKTYQYKIIDIYDIEKTGKASIRKNTSKSSITLITCRHNTNKQIIVIGELIA